MNRIIMEFNLKEIAFILPMICLATIFYIYLPWANILNKSGPILIPDQAPRPINIFYLLVNLVFSRFFVILKKLNYCVSSKFCLYFISFNSIKDYYEISKIRDTRCNGSVCKNQVIGGNFYGFSSQCGYDGGL